MCRVGQYGLNLDRIMPLEEFEKIISQINGLKTVRLNGLGESTLVPNFDKYLDCLIEKKLKIELITNGSGKLEDYKKILKNDGFVIISWDAAEKEIFEKLRRPAKWETFVKKIKDLTFDLSHSELKKTALLFTLQESNIGQLSKLVLKCKKWQIASIIVNVVKDNGIEWTRRKMSEIENEFILANKLATKNGISLFLPSQVFGYKMTIVGAFSTSSEKCEMPWKEVVIRWNGDVQACNMFNPYVYGNVRLNSFDDIWNNLFASLFRKMINTSKKHPYCVNCVYFKEAYE
jgi:radical SAM protein with 4Fe4S-binding SPASM domain